jgi:hypothetical protein
VEDEDEEEGENQVVPWAEETEATPPPVASSTSSSSREAAANGANAADCAKVRMPLILFPLFLDLAPTALLRSFFRQIWTLCLPISTARSIYYADANVSVFLLGGQPVLDRPRRPERRGHLLLLPEWWPVPCFSPQEETTFGFPQLGIGAVRECYAGKELFQRGHWSKRVSLRAPYLNNFLACALRRLVPFIKNKQERENPTSGTWVMHLRKFERRIIDQCGRNNLKVANSRK